MGEKQNRTYVNYLDDGGTRVVAIREQVSQKLKSGYYRYDLNGSNMNFFRREITDSKIILDEEQRGILGKISKFWSLRDKYTSHGFPHKRGFLLYGPPGTGKTTILRSVVNDVLARDGLVLELRSISEIPIALNAISDVEGDTSRPKLVVAEDIEHMDSNGLSEILDGVTRLESVLFLATTNNINQVSEKIRNRPSRFDEKLEIGYPSSGIRREYIAGVYSELPSEVLEEMVVKTKGLSIAHIKEILIRKFIYEENVDEILKVYVDQCRKNAEEYGSRGEVQTRANVFLLEPRKDEHEKGLSDMIVNAASEIQAKINQLDVGGSN